MMHDAAHPRSMMRTTIAIDDDVLAAVRAIARQRNETIGKIVSELARHSLRPWS
jgi:Arc/MetJ family transcription regulator